MGFPLISVSQRIDGRKRIIQLKQQRFLADGGSDENNQLWQVLFIYYFAQFVFSRCPLQFQQERIQVKSKIVSF